MTLQSRLPHRSSRIRFEAKRQEELHARLEKEIMEDRALASAGSGEICAGRQRKAGGGVSLGNGNEVHSMQKRIDAASPAAQTRRSFISRIDPTAAPTSEQPWWRTGAFE